MSANVAAGPAAMRARACELRSRAAGLREEALTRRKRSEELCDELAGILVRAGGRSFGGRDRRFTLRLPRVRPMVSFARHDLRRWLEAGDVPQEVVDDVTLACSEACANAVEHPAQAARQLVEIEGRRDDGQIELRVRDYGSWSEHRRSDLRGRGLSMIEKLVDSVEVNRGPDGTQIVMRRALRQEKRHRRGG